jgi:hypothetical protein
MDQENIDAQEVIETPESEVETVETPEGEEGDLAEELARVRKENEDLVEKNKKLYARVKKEDAPKAKEPELSSKDLLFLAKANIHEESLDEVLEWARFKKVTVADAYNQLKSKLDADAEMRKTANVTQVRGGARGTSKVSGEDLLTKAQTTGEVPDSEEGMNAMFAARQAARFK